MASTSDQQLKLQLHYNASAPPVAALFCLSLPREKSVANVEIFNTHQSVLPQVHFALGQQQETIEAADLAITRLICLSLPNCRALISDEVTFWIDFSIQFENSIVSASSANKPVIPSATKPLVEIDNYLKGRTFVIGHQLSLGDIALYSALGKLFGYDTLGDLVVPGRNSSAR